MHLTLKELGDLFPRHATAVSTAQELAGVSTDTRTLKPGELYVAIRGERYDGHNFLDQAIAQGAVATLVDMPGITAPNCFYCDDTVAGLARIAMFYRAKFNQPVLAVTGSSGKTTTKDLLRHVLAKSGPVTATEGNLNNHIGVPLTIFRFTPKARVFIVEMGMNHPGEIAALTTIANPTHALITSIGRAHMEGVGGTLDKVALAKGELFAELDATATAFVNADEPLIRDLPTPARRITYGTSIDCDFVALNIRFSEGGAEFDLTRAGKRYPARIGLTGRHHVLNATAAWAVGSTLGESAADIITALAEFKPACNRGSIIERGNIAFMDDTYNANPDSMRAAFEALTLRYPYRVRIAVLGGMLELGESARELHVETGRSARRAGFAEVFAFGDNADAYLTGFGYSASEALRRHFTDPEAMATAVDQALRAVAGECAVLVKGSRGMRMERVLENLLKRWD